MADPRKVTIEIISRSDESSPVGTAAISDEPNTPDSPQLPDIIHPVKKLEKSRLGKSVLLNQAYELAKNTLRTCIDNSFNRYYSLKENYIGENTYKIATQSINKVISAGTSIAGGFAIGSAPGALIAAAGVGIAEVTQFNQKMSNYYQALNSTKIQTSFNRIRAGLVDGNRGTEN